MKIRKLTPDNHLKAIALLRQAFPRSSKELRLVEKFHKNETEVHEWICIHTSRAIGYIAFSNAYNEEDEICGLHLGPVAVNPEFQNCGVASELIKFALRQPAIKETTLFVLGAPTFFSKFGFEPCTSPICPFDKNNTHFLAMRNDGNTDFIVGYEPEFG